MEQSLTLSIKAAEQAKGSAYQIAQGKVDVETTARAISDLTLNIDKTATTLDKLQSDGKNVSSVVKTIAEIADQTNILALNAAIQASTAGEAGRGFAVVADEVRQLAGRTSQSTAEIDEVVRENNSLAEQAVKSMEHIVSQAKESVELVEKTGIVIDEISSDTKEILSLVQQQVSGGS